MSPIGRVFVVLNLVLAGTFVGFAGTYLKNHTNWKEKHTTLQTKADKDIKDRDSQIEDLKGSLGTAQRENGKIDSLNKAQKSELDDKRADNEALRKQMASLEADIKTIKADNSTVAAKISEATEDAKKTLQLALAADDEKHKAMNAQKEAEAKLADANAKIAGLETKLADAGGDLQKREQTIEELKLIVAAWQIAHPGEKPNAQADVEGRVHLVSGNLVTIQITDEKGGKLQKGNTFAAFSGSSYKGDIQITSVEGNFAMGKVTVPVDGKPISVGDRVSTNLVSR
jgi:DNA repair exonuclease SbcCD ATPase subunit